VNFILIAGDLYDGDWRDYNTALYLARQMSRLREAGIRVIAVCGNHDAASRITKSLKMPENFVFLPVRQPDTVRLDEISVAVHGQGFRQQAVTDDLSTAYPLSVRNFYNIGLLHTSVTGRDGHEPYAPCSVDRLIAKGYDYWALGHVHAREVLREDPWIIFPGNIQGRHVRESGPKGCTLVTVDDGHTACVEHRDLHVLEWAKITVAADEAGSPEEVVDRARRRIQNALEGTDGRFLAARITVTGASPSHIRLSANPEKWTAAMRAEATDVGGGAVWIEKVELRTSAALDLDELLKGGTPLGGLLRFIQEYGEASGLLAAVKDDLDQLKGKLPSEFFAEHDPLSLSDPEKRREVLEDVKQLLIPRLLSAGAGK
jgi:hypothetical protein